MIVNTGGAPEVDKAYEISIFHVIMLNLTGYGALYSVFYSLSPVSS